MYHPDITSKLTSDTENESFDDSLVEDNSPSDLSTDSSTDSSTDLDKVEKTLKRKRNKKLHLWKMNVSKSKRLKGENHISS